MAGARWMDRKGGWAARLLLLLLAAPPGCSSTSQSAADAAADTASPDAAADASSPEDADSDARGGTGGTVRGGSGGTNRGGSGGTGGMSPDAGPEPEAPPPPPPANDTCQGAQPIVLDKARVEVSGTTRGARHDLELACNPGAGDVVFSFSLPDRSLVYADTFGATFDTIVAFTDACAGTDGGAPAASTPACVDDACGTKQSQAVAVLAPGKHYLVVSSAHGESGDFTLHLEHAAIGSGMVAGLAAGTATVTGTTAGEGRLSLCEAGGPESSYWWTACPAFAGGVFMASTCNNTMYDTILSLQIPRVATPASPAVCNDDACLHQAAITTTLPPGGGLHVLTVDGYTPRHQGAYTLTTTRP